MSNRDLMGVATIPTRGAIEAAGARIGRHVRRTPVLALGPSVLEFPVVLKLEHLQVTGSFKPRGAFNALLSRDVPRAGVVAASGGNFGLAVGHAASALGHRAEIFVPETSPAAKIDRVRRTGADVHVIAGYYDAAAAAARAHGRKTGAVELHPFDQIEVVEGGGTVGAELEDQVPDADTIVVAVGGGGLIGGIASWFAGRVRVVGVEPETSRCLDAAREASEPVDVDVSGIAADSLGPRRVGAIAFAVSSAGFIDRSILVSDEAIRTAQRALWDEVRVAAEPGGATAMAALMTGAYRPAAGERVVVLVCGANADPALLA